MEDSEEPKINKHRHFKLGAFLLVIGLIILLFKFDLAKIFNSPQFQKNVDYIEAKINFAWGSLFSIKLRNPNLDDETFNKVIKPEKINDYFGNVTEDKINELSKPTVN